MARRGKVPPGFHQEIIFKFLKKRVIRLHKLGRPKKGPQELSPSATRILRWLRAHADETGKWVGRQSVICRTSKHHYDPRTIRRAVAHLEALGYLRRITGNGIQWGVSLKGNKYQAESPDRKIASAPPGGQEISHKTLPQNHGVYSPTAQQFTGPGFGPVNPPPSIPITYTPVMPQQPMQPLQERLQPLTPAWSRQRTRLYFDPITGKKYFKNQDGQFVPMS